MVDLPELGIRMEEAPGRPVSAAASAHNLLTALGSVSHLLNSTLHLDDTLAAVLEAAIGQAAAKAGQVSLYDPVAKRFRTRVQVGPDFDVGPLVELVHKEQKPHYAADTVDLPRLDDWQPGNSYVVPIQFQGNVAGLLQLAFEHSAQLSEEIEAFLATLANFAAIALGNADRFTELTERNAELQRRAQQMERLLESGRVFRSDSPMAAVYEELVYSIQEGLGFNVVRLSLLEEALGEKFLHHVMSAGLPLDELRELQQVRTSWESVARQMKQRFALGGAYYIPAEQRWTDPALITGGVSQDTAIKRRDATAWHPEDQFFVPLRDSMGDPLGLIALEGPSDGRRPDLNTARVLEIFSNQAAATIENARLFHDTRRYAQQLQQLQEVSQEVLAESDAQVRLQLIVRALQATGWQRVALTLRDPDFEPIELVTVGLSAHEEDMLRQSLLPAETWRSHLNDPDFQQFRRGACYFVPYDSDWAQKHLTDPGALSAADSKDPGVWHPEDVLCVPLYDRQQRPLALISLDEPVTGRRPDAQMLQIIDLYARFAAIAIQNTQLVAELRELNEELDERVAQRTQELAAESERVKILLRISTDLSASLDKDRVLGRALHLVNESVHATQGNILLLDSESEELVFHASFDLERETPPLGMRSSVSSREGLAGWVIRHRRSAIVQDTRADPRWIARSGSSRRHRSVLAVPLMTGDDVIGIMMLFHSRPNAFTENQLALVTAAGVQVAHAVYNANLYDLIRQQAESLGTMMREARIEVAKTHAILESIADGVLVARRDGEIILVNYPTCNILGKSRSDLLGHQVDELSGEYGPSGDEWLAKMAEWSERAEGVLPSLTHGGTLTPDDKIVSIIMSPVFANRQYIGTVSIFRDITKEVEVDRMKSEFVSTVSHELRTPMTSIKGYADLMLMGATGSLEPYQERYLRVIKKNADRLKALVDELLDISRIETGKTQLNTQPLDVVQVIQSVVHDHIAGRLQNMDKSITLATEIEPALPLAQGDPEKVTRILMNLMDNALNYTPAGEHIIVSADADQEFVYVSVVDTGIGIPAHELPKVFDRFYRAEQEAVQEVPGTGLGLAIVRSLVEMHGGTIEVESTLGEGSCFKFSLPLADDRVGP